jgi:hypothetical protein
LVTGGTGFVGGWTAVERLGWRPRSWQDAVTASAESILRLSHAA